MTDKELLEQAAKAAGIDLSSWDWRVNSFCTGYGDTEDFESWNPLTDDGDALRLAVKLELDVDIWPDEIIVVGYNGLRIIEELIDDLYAATRRAIVRAAAEIGKDMK